MTSARNVRGARLYHLHGKGRHAPPARASGFPSADQSVIILEGEKVKLHYYPETDSLYVDLNSRPSADSREIAEGLVIDFGTEGNIVGIDIDHAS